MTISPEIRKQLGTALEKIPTLAAAYLFGSAATDRVSTGSDIDIAVLCTEKPGYRFIQAVLCLTQDILKRDDVDVCLLNEASPQLAFEALHGIRLVIPRKQTAAAFESLVAREYEDEMARLHHCRTLYSQA